ncbi:MAG: UbiA family prenyltransferase, partial [Pseudomonadota bacterium]
MTDTSINKPETGDAQFSDFFALLKPRVMSLVVFTALVGLLVAPGTIHPFLAFCGILFVAIGAGASGALNMWWDADIDRIMRRTQKRPIPAGKVTSGDALAIGLALSGFSVVLLWLATNALAAGLLAFTIFFYAVVYSMWLKRST